MAKFRKKPVVIDAFQFDKKDSSPILKFVEDLTSLNADKFLILKDENWYVRTLEGNMLISDRDFLIRGVNGEFYPCKPDIFAKTYDEVE